MISCDGAQKLILSFLMRTLLGQRISPRLHDFSLEMTALAVSTSFIASETALSLTDAAASTFSSVIDANRVAQFDAQFRIWKELCLKVDDEMCPAVRPDADFAIFYLGKCEV